jgi:hypothetical protein
MRPLTGGSGGLVFGGAKGDRPDALGAVCRPARSVLGTFRALGLQDDADSHLVGIVGEHP